MRTNNANGISIKKYTWDVVDSNAYLINLNNHGLLIDTVDSQELYQEILRLNDLTIILTHSHFDHIYGLNAIRKIAPESIVISTKQCSDNLTNPYKNMSASANAYLSFSHDGGKKCRIDPFVCDPSDTVFEREKTFEWNNSLIQLKSCYGHSNDGLLAMMDNKWLFSGDTLLPIPTVTRFIGGSTKKFHDEDIPYLESLAGKIEKVFPGHGSPGMLECMLEHNLKCE